MLRLFRHIRQRLFLESKMSRYAGYAIGEIVLIVVGILIALQIQTWNEFRKDRVIEIEALQNMAENLEINIQKLEGKIDGIGRDIESADLLISTIGNKLPYDDSLDRHFGLGLNPIETESSVSVAGYETLKDVGMVIVQDKQLRKEIVDLFEETYLHLNGRLDRAGKQYMEIIKLRQQHFLRKPRYRFAPFDYDKLIQDQHFYSWLITINDSRSFVMGSIEKSLEETQRVLGLIHAELEKIN